MDDTGHSLALSNEDKVTPGPLIVVSTEYLPLKNFVILQNSWEPNLSLSVLAFTVHS